LNVDCLSCASLANDDDASDEEDLESEWSYPDETSSSELDDSDDDDSIDSGGLSDDDTSSSTDTCDSSSDDSNDENKTLYEENDWELVGLSRERSICTAVTSINRMCLILSFHDADR
jgi:hypothetical protein